MEGSVLNWHSEIGRVVVGRHLESKGQIRGKLCEGRLDGEKSKRHYHTPS